MQKSYLVPLAEPPASDRMTFVTVMNFILRNIRFMALCGLALAVVSPLPLVGRTPKYTATARFITDAERPVGRFLGDLTLPGTAGRGPEFFIELLRSPVVLEGVVTTPVELKPGQPPMTLVQHYTGQPPTDPEAVQGAIGTVLGRISASPSPTGILTLRVTAEDPHVAAAIARTLMEQVDAFNEDKMHSHANRERQFAEQRLQEVNAELRQAEAEWLAFVDRNRIVSAPALQLQQQRIQDSLGRKRALAATLVAAIERSKLEAIREAPRAVVLSPPMPPTSPSHISWWRVALVGFFAGMLIGGMIALVRDYFRHVSSQPTPEAQEFAALTAASTERLGAPLRAFVSGARKPPHPPLQ
jgi:uncharacterized protein involved in exopolysaccharide biosynthesis